MIQIDIAMPRNCGSCPFMRPKPPYPCYCIVQQMPIKPSETDLRDGLCPLKEVKQNDTNR